MGDWWVAWRWRDPLASGAHTHVDHSLLSAHPQPPPPSTEGHYLLILAADLLSLVDTNPTPRVLYDAKKKKGGGRSERVLSPRRVVVRRYLAWTGVWF